MSLDLIKNVKTFHPSTKTPFFTFSFQLSALQGTHALPVFSLVGTSLEVNPNNIDDDICEIEQSDSRKCRTAEVRLLAKAPAYDCTFRRFNEFSN